MRHDATTHRLHKQDWGESEGGGISNHHTAEIPECQWQENKEGGMEREKEQIEK
jgi:hypothetical protein